MMEIRYDPHHARSFCSITNELSFLTAPSHPSRSSGMALPAPYYQPEEDDERPFICSLASDNGIMSCTDVPARREGGRTCCLDKEDALHRQALGLSPEPLANGSGAGEAMGLCINWNQYYTRCNTGSSNPHKGAINFDNIVYAWIVIFQVWITFNVIVLNKCFNVFLTKRCFYICCYSAARKFVNPPNIQ